MDFPKVNKQKIFLFFKKILSLHLIVILITLSLTQNSMAGYHVHCWNPFTKGMKFSHSLDGWKSKYTNYFLPLIDVSSELCMFFCCGKETSTLKWYGQCKIFWLTGFDRVCARPARAGQHGNTDPKYTKLCAYNDPCFPLDGNDWDGTSMPHHWKTSMPSGGDDANTAAGALLAASAISALMITPGTAALMAIGAGFAKLIALMLQTINYTVFTPDSSSTTDTHPIACVDIPLAPSPPPFCPTLPVSPPMPEVIPVCKKEFSPDITQISTSSGVCELGQASSKKYSTFEKPVVRIGFSNQLTTCDSVNENYYNNYLATGQDPDNKYLNAWGQIPWCVMFKNINVDDKIATANFNQDNSGIINYCSGSETSPCITFPIPNYNTSGTYRTKYILKDSSGEAISFSNSLTGETNTGYSSWISTTDPNTVKLAAIENSNFIDMQTQFPANAVTVQPITQTITDTIGNTRTFYIQSSSVTDPSNICVYEKRDGEPDPWGPIYNSSSTDNPSRPDPISCVARPNMPKPVVAKCGDRQCITYGGIERCVQESCSSTFTAPGMAFGLGQDAFQTGSIQYNKNSPDTSKYLHGYPFYIKLTDILNNSMDNDSHRIGSYKYEDGTVVPSSKRDLIVNQLKNLNGSGEIVIEGKKIIYQGGLEFANGIYKRGATKVCLEGYVGTDQVLAKKNSNGQASLIASDRIIPPYVEGQTVITTSYRAAEANSAGVTTYPGDTIDYYGRPGGAGTTIKTDIEMLRPKTGLENGLCIDAPTPKCPAINYNSSANGYARWPESGINQLVSGKCFNNSARNKPVRRCEFDDTNWSQGVWRTVSDPCRSAPPYWWPSSPAYDISANCPNCRNGLTPEQWEQAWYNYPQDISTIFNNNDNVVLTDVVPHVNVLRNGSIFCHIGMYSGTKVWMSTAFGNYYTKNNNCVN